MLYPSVLAPMFSFRKIITGLESMTSGVIRIMDMEYPKEWKEIQKLLGLCPQHAILYPE